MQTKNMLKAGTGTVAPLIAGALRIAAVALVVLWPFALLLPINLKVALAVGVPYAVLAGAVVCGITRKGR